MVKQNLALKHGIIVSWWISWHYEFFSNNFSQNVSSRPNCFLFIFAPLGMYRWRTLASFCNKLLGNWRLIGNWTIIFNISGLAISKLGQSVTTLSVNKNILVNARSLVRTYYLLTVTGNASLAEPAGQRTFLFTVTDPKVYRQYRLINIIVVLL